MTTRDMCIMPAPKLTVLYAIPKLTTICHHQNWSYVSTKTDCTICHHQN
ncbi:unnamed protein product [Callosobruchus maculatus]|uniref:Uncharacterized protein n=1 Tax=Callosobruchus maculatus TaxID=64391 RepID=A0A653BRB8_CALMS|nr:unnamed protein product [Callosobruchus maculatus]